MYIKVVSIDPNKQSLHPELIIRAEMKCDSNILPTEVSCVLNDKNFKIANAITSHTRGDNFYVDYKNRSDRRILYYFHLFVPLDKLAIEYLQDLRDKSSKHDINLQLKFVVKSIEPNVNEHKLPEGVVALKSNNSFFINVKTYEFSQEIVISSSDWVQDYLPVFVKEKYLILEINEPQITSENEFWNERLKPAINALTSVESKIKQGEWAEAIEKARPLIELLNNNSELKKLFIESGLSEAAAINLIDSISGLFAFTSKFIHKIEHKSINVNPDLTAHKEDAYLIYSLSSNMINMIVKKINRMP
ncbi:MAG: hypothetical protein JWM14_1563 [Chitinophagaceae bacterium]|nr:hypothetical protein [Chitinophagaceae bacterium]